MRVRTLAYTVLLTARNDGSILEASRRAAARFRSPVSGQLTGTNDQ
jgi:hypothetical protein